MIDFLVKNKLSHFELLNFLSKVFDCSHQEISLITEDILNNTNHKLNTENIFCLCVYIDVHGDASTMLQIYRSKINSEKLAQKISIVAKKLKIPCYIPTDSFDNWLYIDKNSESHSVRQISFEDQNFFQFERI